MVPQAAPAQPAPETLHVTFAFVLLVTVAVNCCVRPSKSDATVAGETLTVTVGGGGGGVPPPLPPQPAASAARVRVKQRIWILRRISRPPRRCENFPALLFTGKFMYEG